MSLSPSPAGHATQRRWSLIVEGPDGITTERELDPGPSIIGRDLSCDICLLDRNISRKHAVFEQDAEGLLWLDDRGGPSGTYLNGARVEGRVRLYAGDVLHIGGHCLELRSSTPSPRRDVAMPSGGRLPTHVRVHDRPGVFHDMRLDQGIVVVGAGDDAAVRLDEGRFAGVRIVFRPRKDGGFDVLDESAEPSLTLDGREQRHVELSASDRDVTMLVRATEARRRAAGDTIKVLYVPGDRASGEQGDKPSTAVPTSGAWAASMATQRGLGPYKEPGASPPTELGLGPSTRPVEEVGLGPLERWEPASDAEPGPPTPDESVPEDDVGPLAAWALAERDGLSAASPPASGPGSAPALQLPPVSGPVTEIGLGPEEPRLTPRAEGTSSPALLAEEPDDDAATVPLRTVKIERFTPTPAEGTMTEAASPPTSTEAASTSTVKLPPAELRASRPPEHEAGPVDQGAVKAQAVSPSAEHDHVPLSPALPLKIVAPALGALALCALAVGLWPSKPAPGNLPAAARPEASARAADPDPPPSAASPPAALSAASAPAATQEPPAAASASQGGRDAGPSDSPQDVLRRRLEAKAKAGKASREDLRQLLSLCARARDAACIAQTRARMAKKEKPQ